MQVNASDEVVGSSPTMWWGIIAAVAVILLGALMSGCAVTPANLPVAPSNNIPVAASSVDKAKAHVDSAESLVVRAKPEATPTGQALLGAVSDEHVKADAELTNAKSELGKVQVERDQFAAQVQAQTIKLNTANATITKIKSGWGYRLQVFVASVFWTIVSITFLHFALGIASIFVTGPVGLWLGRIGGFLNPLAWFQWARDHLSYTRANPCPPVILPATVSTV